MHRLQYNKKEYDTLLEYLGPLPHYSIAYLTMALESITEDPTTDYDHKQLYVAIKNNTQQSIWQTIYHTPLHDIPLLINSENPTVQAIVKWRLAIAR